MPFLYVSTTLLTGPLWLKGVRVNQLKLNDIRLGRRFPYWLNSLFGVACLIRVYIAWKHPTGCRKTNHIVQMKLIASTHSNDTWWMANMGMNSMFWKIQTIRNPSKTTMHSSNHLLYCNWFYEDNVMLPSATKLHFHLWLQPKARASETTQLHRLLNRGSHFHLLLHLPIVLSIWVRNDIFMIPPSLQHPSPFAGAGSLFWGLATQCLDRRLWNGSLMYMYFSLATMVWLFEICLT